MVIIKQILNSFLFWGGWIIIPFIMEIVPALGSVFLLIRRNLRHKKKRKEMKIYPEISLIIPVYNSADTLYGCIKSVNDSTYPNDKIRIFLVNNKGQDNSFAVYADCQKKFPDLLMQWLNAEQGKSRALNLALYNSDGKYIINLDSDGILEKNALICEVHRLPCTICLYAVNNTCYSYKEYKEIKERQEQYAPPVPNIIFLYILIDVKEIRNNYKVQISGKCIQAKYYSCRYKYHLTRIANSHKAYKCHNLNNS
jgi:glycosyltransferase involved in cell wall biosynthesis